MGGSRPLDDLGLYVHFPWCVKKCPYCDFNSHPVTGAINEPQYLDRLQADLDRELTRSGDTVTTVYCGGGTPSLFSPESFARLLAHPALASAREITMEANPGTLERGVFADYREAGITRVSIGVQSFDPAQLNVLGRIHNASEAERAVTEALAAGFDDVNLDLMYGLPGQTVAAALTDLTRAIDLGPTHLSWYQLTLEPKTEFAKRPPVLPVAEIKADIDEAGRAYLAAAGFERYEISAYGRAGSRSQHNVNYWRFGDYLGVGAGAHGKISTSNGILRTAQAKQPRLYLAGQTPAESHIAAPDIPIEFMMNVLRLRNGVPEELFQNRTGLAFDTIAETIYRMRDWGLMQADRIALTDYGYAHLDQVVAEFLPT